MSIKTPKYPSHQDMTEGPFPPTFFPKSTITLSLESPSH